MFAAIHNHRLAWHPVRLSLFSSGTDPRKGTHMVDSDEVAEGARTLRIWKAVRLGLYKSADEYRAAIKSKNWHIGPLADTMLDKMDFSAAPESAEVDLVALTISDLGFTFDLQYDDLYNASYRKIFDRAMKLGLRPCPAEVGPNLRVAYTDQPYGEWIIVATEPTSNADSGLFEVVHDGDTWLYAHSADPEQTWLPHNKFVFVRPY